MSAPRMKMEHALGGIARASSVPSARRALPALAGLVAALALGGCVNLAPELQRPALAVPAQLPAPAGSATGTVAQADWQALLQDDRLRQVVALALQNNRDLRVAVLNVERSQAALRLSDADRWPTVSAALIGQRTPSTSTGKPVNSFQAGLQVSSYELDLLGRLRNASDAAAATLMGTEAAARSARLALETQVAGAWLTLAADAEQLALARKTLATRDETLKLTTLRAKVGAVADIDLTGVQALSAAAQSAVAQLERQVAQDRNALTLLVGTTVPEALLPATPLQGKAWLAAVPAGLSSQALLSRPDVIQAEQTLAAANANIGVARAAMWPRITLSGSGGQASSELSSLFDPGHFAFTLAANAGVALFDAGRNRANVASATAGRDIAVAQYEKAVQMAFREAADALQSQASWTTQLQAQKTQLAAERERHRLTKLRYDVGGASLLDWLDAERSLVTAEQAMVQVQLGELLNRLALYKALGGSEAAASGAGSAG